MFYTWHRCCYTECIVEIYRVTRYNRFIYVDILGTCDTVETSNTCQTSETKQELIMMYHVIVKNIKTGVKVYMTATPVPHNVACVLLSKLTKHPTRIETLEQV